NLAIAALLVSACAGPPQLLSGARVLVAGVGVPNQDCRAAVCPHNENTDLVKWNGGVWLVHRTALSQILGPNSALHVHRSRDGRAFEHRAQLVAPSYRDLRDPHFYA